MSTTTSPVVLTRADDIAAEQLMAALLSLAAQPQPIVLERVAQLLANHAQARVAAVLKAFELHRKLAEQLAATRTALIVAGFPDDELLDRLKLAEHSARNGSLPTMKPRSTRLVELCERLLGLDTKSPAARVLEERSIARELAELKTT